MKSSTERFNCAVYSGRFSVNFYSEFDLFELFSNVNCHQFIPEFSIHKNISQTDAFVSFRNENEKTMLKWFPNGVECCSSLEHMRKGEAILHLGYPLLELERQKMGGVTIHAASCQLDGRGILILGKEGSGKTSTLIRLCQEHKARLIGNDLTLLDQTYLSGGTKFFYLRYISVQKSLPHLCNFFPEKEKDPWRNKIFLQPSALNIQIEKNPIPLTRAYLVHVDEEQNYLIKEDAKDLTDRLYINENFSRYIRNTCTTFLGNTGYLGFVPSFDNENLYFKRLKLMNYIFDQANLFYISGNSREIAKSIKNG